MLKIIVAAALAAGGLAFAAPAEAYPGYGCNYADPNPPLGKTCTGFMDSCYNWDTQCFKRAYAPEEHYRPNYNS